MSITLQFVLKMSKKVFLEQCKYFFCPLIAETTCSDRIGVIAADE